MKRLIGVVSLLVAAFGCGGCMFSLGGVAGGSTSASLHFEGTIVSPANWVGTGNVCYTLNILGSDTKHDCPIFKTDRPGHFTVDQDITDLVTRGGLVTSSDLYITVNGQRADPQSFENNSKSRTLGGTSVSTTLINASFALPPSALANSTEAHDPNSELSSSLQSLDGNRAHGLAPSVGQRANGGAPELLSDGGAPASLSTAAK